MDAIALIDFFDELDDEEHRDVVGRRQYRMMDRLQVDAFDDVDFIFRFRLSKQTFVDVLDMIRADLEYIMPR